MKKEEPSVISSRGNPPEQADLYPSGGVGSETTGSLSRPGRTVTARTEQPALSRALEFLMAVAVDDSNTDATPPSLHGFPTCILRRTAVCGPACTVVWGPGRATASGYPILYLP
jgi:hypothetical protein